MVVEAVTKVRRVGPRHTVYLPKGLVEDSMFPFKVGEKLIVRVNGRMLVLRNRTDADAHRKLSGHKIENGVQTVVVADGFITKIMSYLTSDEVKEVEKWLGNAYIGRAPLRPSRKKSS